MSTLYKMILATFVAINSIAAQSLTDSTIKTAIDLRPVIIEASAKNNPTGPIYAENIQHSRTANALDAIVKLRPAILNRETGACTSQDSLTLYVNGIRRSNMNRVVQNAPQDSSSSDDIWSRSGKNLDNSVVGFRPDRKTSARIKQTNTDWIKTELSTIHSSDVKSIHYVPCDGWSREIGIKNVIWIELK